MTHIEIIDNGALRWNGIDLAAEPLPASTIHADDLDQWFWEWARACARKDSGVFQQDGVFLIHANARFTPGASRQDLQGIELLKHIRLTRWLGPARTWHAIVYSFEPLVEILSRKPGDLILTSPGVTFLRLPEALSLGDALMRAYPREVWASLSLQEILARLPKASPRDRGFRRYIAGDYTPPDSAHSISNWWGIYEMWLAASGMEFPEYADSSRLPQGIRDFVLRLETKKADFLEGSREDPPDRDHLRKSLGSLLAALKKTSAQKAIVYVDDEASNGWTTVFEGILDGAEDCTLHTIDRASLALPNPNNAGNRPAYRARIKEIARTINGENPQLLILDLRLRGNSEADQPPNKASGMDLARAVRSSNRYLPILLFTASNKAETLTVSGSLDIDNYWMKPGLGEHRSMRSREEDLFDLVKKLTVLLGDDYGWLQRISNAVDDIRAAKVGFHWWERKVRWPSPARQPDVQKGDSKRRTEVLEYLDSILYTVRMILKLQAASTVYLSPKIAPKSLDARLCAGLFNQIGQVVELVHDASDKKTDPAGGKFAKAGNGRIGGYKDDDKGLYVFRRQDWWAFYLFAWRNKLSHPGSTTDLNEVKYAASDLVAWLTLAPPGIETAIPLTREEIAAEMLPLGPYLHHARFPILRLDAQEPSTAVRVSGISVPTKEPTGILAQDHRFRKQLAMRPEFTELHAKSMQLLDG